MRMRRKKNLTQRLESAAKYLEREPEKLRGKWREHSSGRPIWLEIGCGKGRFICAAAEESPELFYVAMERVGSVIVMAMEKAQEQGLENLIFINGDASRLNDIFAPGEVDGIYLNFSDPWPSNRHINRRLTSEGFLSIYKSILKPDGRLCFKTDNRGLFDFSVSELKKYGWRLENLTYDLHGTGERDKNVHLIRAPGSPCMAVTEYEERFMAQGIPINRLEAIPPILS